ncbi:glycosyltransferase [Sabulicella glaciei]|uniref:Glycosyltransferase n=1 Tax=Sabulicella glaciei TaxID=2984948 RepID=A0ABT3P010_9PROT|nr:glycosyltransferase [Roseococcus sp. MDT2-1-1]MCW8087741.1 glycosyltransferase [Roseococcus sp. MDT2-1-1]
MTAVAHLLSGLTIGGKERAALRLARRGLREGQDHALVLFDQPFRGPETDFDPGEVPTHFLPRGGGLDLRFAWRLARLLRRMGAGAIHAHNDTALFYAALASRLLLRRPPRVVATFHTWPSHPTSHARRLNRLASRVAEVAAVSDELSERLRVAGWLGPCSTIWNGVDQGEFFPAPAPPSWRREMGIGDDAILVGHVARLDPIKRHADLLEAAATLARTAPRVVFLLVGQGPLAEQVRRDAAGLGNIRFLSQAADMAALMRGLDLITLCSAHEAAPLVLLEGMACGVPVVATHVGGIPHMVGTGGDAAGLLVPPFDPSSLAAAIGRLAAHAEERAHFSAAAARRAAAFSFEAEWSAYDRLYRGEA